MCCQSCYCDSLSLIGVRSSGTTLAVGVGNNYVHWPRLGARWNRGVDIAARRGLNRRQRAPHKDFGPEDEARAIDGNASPTSNASRIWTDAADTRRWRLQL